MSILGIFLSNIYEAARRLGVLEPGFTLEA